MTAGIPSEIDFSAILPAALVDALRQVGSFEARAMVPSADDDGPSSCMADESFDFDGTWVQCYLFCVGGSWPSILAAFPPDHLFFHSVPGLSRAPEYRWAIAGDVMLELVIEGGDDEWITDGALRVHVLHQGCGIEPTAFFRRLIRSIVSRQAEIRARYFYSNLLQVRQFLDPGAFEKIASEVERMGPRPAHFIFQGDLPTDFVPGLQYPCFTAG